MTSNLYKESNRNVNNTQSNNTFFHSATGENIFVNNLFCNNFSGTNITLSSGNFINISYQNATGLNLTTTNAIINELNFTSSNGIDLSCNDINFLNATGNTLFVQNFSCNIFTGSISISTGSNLSFVSGTGNTLFVDNLTSINSNSTNSNITFFTGSTILSNTLITGNLLFSTTATLTNLKSTNSNITFFTGSTILSNTLITGNLLFSTTATLTNITSTNSTFTNLFFTSASGSALTLPSVNLTNQTNQITLQTTNPVIINSGNQSSSCVISLPPVGLNCNFVLSEGGQTIDGTKTFSGPLSQEKLISGGNVSFSNINDANTANSNSYINSIINANNSSAVYASQGPSSSFVWGLNSADSSFQLCSGLLLNTGTFMKIDNSSNINLIGNSLNLSTGTFLFPSATGTNLSASSYFFTQTGTEFVAGLNPSASNNFQLCASSSLGTNIAIQSNSSGQK